MLIKISCEVWLSKDGQLRNDLMDELKAQIQFEASQAARMSREATKAFEARDWKQGKALMKDAVAAFSLIKLLRQSHKQKKLNKLLANKNFLDH